jgi:hypothetical protein
MPTDFETYFMNLTMANMNTTQDPEWMSAGMFSKVFELNDTSPESMHELLTDIASDFSDMEEEEEAEEDASEADVDNATTTTVAPSTSSSTTSTSASDATTSKTDDEDDEEADADDRLYELYWMFNSYSDAFNRSDYDRIAPEDKRKFLCRLLTGQSHDALACDEFLPTVTLVKVASEMVDV